LYDDQVVYFKPGVGNHQRITLIGGPPGREGWRAVFPNEKCELSAGCTEDRSAYRRAAQNGCLAGCRKGEPSVPPFSTA